MKDEGFQKIDDLLMEILRLNGYTSAEQEWEIAHKEFKSNISISVVRKRLIKLTDTGTIKYKEIVVNRHTLKLYCLPSFVRD